VVAVRLRLDTVKVARESFAESAEVQAVEDISSHERTIRGEEAFTTISGLGFVVACSPDLPHREPFGLVQAIQGEGYPGCGSQRRRRSG
jgi:hypothetical protein